MRLYDAVHPVVEGADEFRLVRRAELPYDFLDFGDGKRWKAKARFARNVLTRLREFENLERVPAPAPQFRNAERCVDFHLIHQLVSHFHFDGQVGRRIDLEVIHLLDRGVPLRCCT